MMNDPQDNKQNDQNDSYVDRYDPPTDDQGGQQAGSQTSDSFKALEEAEQAQAAAGSDDANTSPPGEAHQMPADTSSSNNPTPAASSSGGSVSQALEDQNIFFLLGVTDGTDDEREEFLDELQQVIWDDFIENDVELLITEEEMEGLEKIMGATGKSEEEMQEEMIVYLEKLIPDLEEIMLEKALELKEDMVKERMIGMREYYASDQDALGKIDQADELIADGLWRDAAELLNGLPA